MATERSYPQMLNEKPVTKKAPKKKAIKSIDDLRARAKELMAKKK